MGLTVISQGTRNKTEVAEFSARGVDFLFLFRDRILNRAIRGVTCDIVTKPR
jgi:hypothetical protein